VKDPLADWKAFFVREEANVGIYDIYNDADEWVAQCRFDRRRGADVYLLLARDNLKGKPLEEIKGRDQWRRWLQLHQGNL